MPLKLKSEPVPQIQIEAVSAPVRPCPRTTEAASGLVLRMLDFDRLPTVMSEAEAAAFLNLPAAKLRRMAYDRVGPKHKKVGRDHLYRRDDLMIWLAE